mmetsp:Transcript_17659/g.28717  ORF Transcript_17659/g.28717 Transcript_17659/m.28717 type:complete len:100 (+) Transcript_17659:73-372(+)
MLQGQATGLAVLSFWGSQSISPSHTAVDGGVGQKKKNWSRAKWDLADADFVFHQYPQEQRTMFEPNDTENPARNESALGKQWDTWQLVRQIRSGQYRIK